MRSVSCIVMGLLLAFAASGQDVVSIIETDAEATIDSVPSYVEFSLSTTSSGATLSEAVTKVLQFEPKLREQIEEAELSAKEMSFSSVVIPKVDGKQATVNARLRFSTLAYTANGDGTLQFAALCDGLVKIAETIGATLDGPDFGVDNPAPVEQAAVSRAIELAYPGAEAAAAIMRGQIMAVDKVTILGMEWSKASDALQPDLRRVTCTAKVRVSYAFGPAVP